MSLADDIGLLRDRTLDELASVFDYYEGSQLAWDLLCHDIATGRTLALQQYRSGRAVVSSALLQNSNLYLERYLIESSFLKFIAIAEAYFTDLLRAWLTAHPRSMLAKKIESRVVIEAPSREVAVATIVEHEVNEVAYRSPRDWFAHLDKLVKFGGPSEDDVSSYADAKAVRDILVHNSGLVSPTFVAKVRGPYPLQFPLGHRVELTELYHQDVWDLLRRIVAETAEAVRTRA